MNEQSNSDVQKPILKRSEFGVFQRQSVEKISIDFPEKIHVAIINYGAIITDIHIPDKNGMLENIVLSYNSLEQYIEDKYYIGAAIGRSANRIENGFFQLNENDIQLSQNAGKHHLHGGNNGFNKVLWKIESVNQKASHVEIHMSHFSKDGTEGYPGNLKVDVFFKVFPEMLEIEINGISDQDSIFNPTHHSYFNLSGNDNLNINSHSLKINSDEYVEVDGGGIATGKLIPVSNTDFDFKNAKLVNGAYDNCWALNGDENQAVLEHKGSGRVMRLSTNSPGLQVYTANDFLEEGAVLFKKHHSICLEPEYFPNSPNHSNFPDASLKANALRKFTCAYKFGLI